MTEKELSRYEIINNLINNKINGTDASKQVGVSVRQTKRLKAKVLKYGAKGLIHSSRGKESNRKLDSETIKKANKLLKEKYYFCKPTLASEKLAENHAIQINKETVRWMMIGLGLWKQKIRKQSKKWHTWRARKYNFGDIAI